MKSKEFKGIIVNQNVKNALLPGGIIYQDVLTIFGFNLILNKTSERVNPLITKSGCSKYASISW